MAIAFLAGYVTGEFRRDTFWKRTAERTNNILWVAGKRYRIRKLD